MRQVEVQTSIVIIDQFENINIESVTKSVIHTHGIHFSCFRFCYCRKLREGSFACPLND